MREREQRRDFEMLADEYGVVLEVGHTSKGHVRVIFRVNNKATAMTVAKGHGGDFRGRQNNLARARRQLRELTGKTP